MAYDPKLDKVIKEWRIEISNDWKLLVAIRQYEDGESKVQIGPYIKLGEDKKEIVAMEKTGRFSQQETYDLSVVLEEAFLILDKM